MTADKDKNAYGKENKAEGLPDNFKRIREPFWHLRQKISISSIWIIRQHMVCQNDWERNETKTKAPSWFWNYRITFSLTSSSASTYSSSSWLLLSPLLTAFIGRSHASFMDLRPKNNKRVTAAYSPIGNAVWMTTERNFHVKNDW